MKKIAPIILFFFCVQIFYGQDNIYRENPIDTSQMVKEIHFFQDTLWVMDSSYGYYKRLYDDDLYLNSIYRTKTRDKDGKKLTGLVTSYYHDWGFMENSRLDSVFYFDGTDIPEIEKNYAWDVWDEIWRDNNLRRLDADTNIIEWYNKSWSNSDGQYKTGYQYLYNYLEENRNSTLRNTFHPETDSWKPNQKDTIFFNTNNKDSIRLSQKWHEGLQLWENSQKTELYYNTGSEFPEIIEYLWDTLNMAWLNDSRYLNQNNEDSLSREITYQNWDKENNVWVWDRKINVLLDEEGRPLENVTLNYDLQDSIWVNQSRMLFEHITYFDVVVNQEWDSISANWINKTRQSRSYLMDYKEDTLQYDVWDVEKQNWVGSSRRVRVFDARNNQTALILEIWNENEELWIKDNYTNYYWSAYNPLGASEYVISEIKVYPNPGSDKLYLTLPASNEPYTFELFDLGGKVLLNQSLIGEKHDFRLDHLHNGLYIIKISNTKGFVETFKWVKN